MELLHSIDREEKNYTKINSSDLDFSFLLDTPFFYLGKNQQVSALVTDANSKKYHSENYLSARTRLLRIIELKQPLPELLIIDLPFNSTELASFMNWLGHTDELRS